MLRADDAAQILGLSSFCYSFYFLTAWPNPV